MTSLRRRQPARHTARRGSLLIALLLVSTLGILGAPFVTISLNESRLQMMAKGRTEALAVAEAGVEHALWEFNHNGGAFTNGWVPANSAPGCTTGDCVQRLGYVVGASGTADILVDGVGPANPTPSIRSTGQGQSSGAKTTVTVTLQKALPPFQQALFGVRGGDVNDITFGGGAMADSYDSSLGAYGGANQFANAEIRVNSTRPLNPLGDGAIVVAAGIWNTVVKGSAYTAPGGGIYDSGDGVTTGVIGTKGTKPIKTFPAPVPPADPAGACTELGSLVVSGSDIRPGNRYCADRLTIDGASASLQFPNLELLYVRTSVEIKYGGALIVGQGTIRMGDCWIWSSGGRLEGTSGQVDVYLGGLKLYGASGDGIMKGALGKPENLRVYHSSLIPGSHELNVWYSRAQFHGIIYSIDDVAFFADDFSTFYGAVIANTLGLEKFAKVHFDEALKSVNNGWPSWMDSGGGGGWGTVKVTSWTRENAN